MMRWRILPLYFLVVLIGTCLPFAYQLAAQTATSGALSGVVSDRTGAALPEADVEIEDLARGTVQSTQTDHEGAYQFSFLMPGRYELTVSRSGFRVQKRFVNVLLGPTVSLNVELAVAEISTSIVVASEAPLIRAENGDVSATVSQSLVSEVPNPGNDLTYIVQTTPGVVMNTDGPNSTGMNFSILGMPSTSYLYSIDGVDNPPTGVLGLLLGQNQVQETTVVSTGYSGQFGNAAGGNINFITKSGSNQFHGNAQYYWNGRVLNANDWFNNAYGVPRPFDVANQWAGSFGGPIRKDKLFFFFDTEGFRVLIPSVAQVMIASPQFQAATIQNIDKRFGPTSASHTFYQKVFDLYNSAPGASSALPGGFVPGDLGCAGPSLVSLLPAGVPCVMHFLANLGAPNQDALTAGRMDWNLVRNDRIYLRFQNTGGHTKLLSPINSVFDLGNQQESWEIQAVETHALNASAANQFLFAYSQIHYSSGVSDLAKAVATLPTHIFFAPPEQLAEPGNSYQTRNSLVQYQISEDFVRAGQRHKVGFGLNLDRMSSNSSSSADVGFLATTIDAFYLGGADSNSPADFSQLFQGFRSRARYQTSWYHLGIYAQDEWHARPGLMLTMTVRAEHQSNLVCETRCFARLTGPFNAVSHNPNQPYNQAILINQKRAFQGLDNILWSPRFSFAWQPFGVKHNTVVRGGIGIFYDSVDSVAGNFEGNPPLINSFTVNGDVLSPGESNSLFASAHASNAAFLNAFASGGTLGQIKNSVPNFVPPNINVSEKHTHEPQYQRWSLQLQQAFGIHTSLSIGYFGHHGIHELVLNPSANAWGFGTLPAGRCPDPAPDCAPDPRFTEVQQLDTKGISNYNGMVVSLQHRFSRWSQGLFQTNYTYSHALDEVSNGGTAPFSNWFRQPFTLSPQDPNNLRGAYGSADYDVRHSLNANYVWELPVKAALGGRGPKFLVNGWQVSGTVFWRTGLPYTVSDISPPLDLVKRNYFSLLYAVPVRPLGDSPPCGKGGAFPLATHPCLPTETLPDWTTPGPNALFVQPGCETGFDVGRLGAVGVCDGPTVSFSQGRNRFRGPHYFNTDFTIMKSTEISRWEGATLRIGVQFFNFFNHPNFGFPVGGLGPPTGLIFYLQQPPTSILGTGPPWSPIDVAPRMIQLKAELKF